jgi:hypothetical protein
MFARWGKTTSLIHHEKWSAKVAANPVAKVTECHLISQQVSWPSGELLSTGNSLRKLELATGVVSATRFAIREGKLDT